MNHWFSFRQKLAGTLKNYSKWNFTADPVAGITVEIAAHRT
jgi:hypothetical protein